MLNDINIVIVNYFCKNETLEAIKSIFLDLQNLNLKFQITVVDNSQNKDKLKDSLEFEYPQVKYLQTEKNLGFAKANNLGFKSAKAKYYLVFNPDARILKDKNTIVKMYNFLEENKKIGILGPKILNLDGSIQDSCYRFNKNSILIKPFKHINWDKKYKKVKLRAENLLMKDFDHKDTIPVDWVLGAAMMIRNKAIEEVGWFDERFFMYLEDCDWCMRMWENGWPVFYYPKAEVVHKHRRDSSKIPGIFKAILKNKLAREHLKSWLKYVWKWRKKFRYYE